MEVPGIARDAPEPGPGLGVDIKFRNRGLNVQDRPFRQQHVDDGGVLLDQGGVLQDKRPHAPPATRAPRFHP